MVLDVDTWRQAEYTFEWRLKWDAPKESKQAEMYEEALSRVTDMKRDHQVGTTIDWH